jgi:hypothetical protein
MRNKMQHHLRKLRSTLKILFTLFCARTFGTYEISHFSDFEYAEYRWKGKHWAFPTTPIEEREI